LKLDEEKHVEASEQRGLHREEVAGEDALGMRAQESGPGHPCASRRRIDAHLLEDRPHRGGRDRDAEALELAGDPPVSPGGVLLGEPLDQFAQLVAPARPSPLGPVGPAAGDEPPVPAEQRLGADEERRPAPPRQGAREPGQQRPIGELELGPGDLATEHGELVAQDEDLDLLGLLAAQEEPR
jgi:hypothetical protein